MKRLIALLLCSSVGLLSAEAGYYRVTYDGGSTASVKAGSGVKLFIDQGQIRILKDKADVATIPAAAVTEITYGQDVHRRVGAAVGLAVVSFGIGGLMALTKSKKHFIGLMWDDGGKKAALRSRRTRTTIAAFWPGWEGITGKKAVDSDTMTVKN